jgi:hypothetical protein
MFAVECRFENEQEQNIQNQPAGQGQGLLQIK